MNPFAYLASLSYRESFFSVVGAGLLTHAVFKRTETHEPIHLALLLLGLPAALTGLIVQHFSSILIATASTFLTYWATLGISIVLYRLSPWHPLAEYPGPLICKVTKFWLAFIALRGRQHIYYYQLHQRYGNFVRIGPNELSIRDAAAVPPLMGPGGLPKGPFWDGRIPESESVKPLIAVRDKAEHTRRRRIWTRAFSTAALKGYETIIMSRCVQLVDGLGSQNGVVDFARWISYFAYDFMNDLAFGGGTEMMRDGDVDGLWHLLEASQKDAIFMSHVPWLGALFLRFPNFAKELKAFREHARLQAVARQERGSPHKDLFHHLMDEDGVAMVRPTVIEVVSDGELAIVAGSDTTSSAISNLFYLLLRNPVAFKRLQAEVDSLGDNGMDFGKQAHLSYLNGAINESLRLFPPVLSGTQRYVNPGSGGRAVGNHYVPEGTSAFIPFYSLHRDPKNFSPLPTSFLPERWLSPDKQMELEPGLFKNQDDVVLDTDAFIPFSFGPNNCVGKNLAWMQMRMLICMVIQRFDMKFEDGFQPDKWEEELLDYNVMAKGRLPVVLTPRDRN